MLLVFRKKKLEHTTAEMATKIVEKYPCQKEFYMKYPDVYKNWRYYYPSVIHSVLYVTIFIYTYYQSIEYDAKLSNLYYYMRLFGYSWISGWSIFGMISIGHDACHKSLFPHKTRFGHFLNQLFSWFFLDCLAMSSYEWSQMHWDHDHYGIIGEGIPSKYYGSTGIFRGFWDIITKDFKRIIQRKLGWKRLIFGVIIRYILWFYCGLIPFIFNTMTALIWMNIFFNIPHVDAARYINYGKNKSNIMVIICRQTWDIYPGNHFMSFISFGLNAHATHHCFPTIPRYLHGNAGEILDKHLGHNYKKCDNFEHYMYLFKQYGYLYMELCGFNTNGKWRRSEYIPKKQKIGLM